MTPAPPPFDSVRVSVTVAADPATAFAVFTGETDLWWRRGPRFRVSGRTPGVVTFEPGVGGRLFETYATEAGERVAVMGRITAWDPPARFSFEWRASNFAGDERTTVDVSFEAAGAGTRVTVHHHGWSTLRPDHPVRHGEEGAAFIRRMGLWWGDLMAALRERIDVK